MKLKDKTRKPKAIVTLKPKPNCKICLGRGWVRYFIPDNNSKEVRPCVCVRAKVDEYPDEHREVEQVIV